MTTARPWGEATPYDELDWGATLDPALRVTGEVIETITIAPSASDAALGLVVESRPAETDPVYGVVGYALITIAATEREHSRWYGRGVVVRPLVTIATSHDRIWVREMPLRIARSAAPAAARAARVLIVGGAP